MVITSELPLSTQGAGTVVDLTPQLMESLSQSGLTAGTMTVFCPGSTGGLTTLEYEPGLLKDLPEFMDDLIPPDKTYHHDETWHDGNGFSHLRSALVGPDITIPFVGGKLTLGTWQQVVFLDFDNKPRQRNLVVQIMGE